MTTPIHPDALKLYRKRKHWTQEQLSEATKGKNKVSWPTIKRIEGTKDGSYQASNRVADTLAKALGVVPEDLLKSPAKNAEVEASLRKYGYRPLRTMLDAETALAFNMVQEIYGIPIRSQIEMAPLFATLLAEASLTWRRDRVTEIEDAASRLMSLGGGHFAFANSAYRAEEGALQERKCIEKRDLFGKYVGDDAFNLGYDPSTNNPFADFLNHFASQVGATTAELERGGYWKTSEGMPRYRIGADMISDLTGDDPDAKYALLRGHVRLKDIPSDLRGDDKTDDRIAWMIAKIPEEEITQRRAEQEAFAASIGLDLDDFDGSENDNAPEGDENA